MYSIKLENRMDTMFKNSGDSKISDPHRLLLNLSDKINLKKKDKFVALSNLSIYYTDKISALIWNEEFELPDGSYSVSYIQDYFDYILEKHGEKTGKKTGKEIILQ